jgi:RNA polymerase sigma-70 factor (ECF subfamily)
MTLRDITLSGVDRLVLEDGQPTAEALSMDDDAFRAFYEQTARPLWRYLARATGDRAAADDLLQEAYYRLLRCAAAFDGDDHRRHYLFRIAANLLRDRHRRPLKERALPEADEPAHPRDDRAAARLAQRRDLDRALAALRPRDRMLLQLAYMLGLSHVEIAGTLGVKPGSIKPLLYRARTRLLARLQRTGSTPGMPETAATSEDGR